MKPKTSQKPARLPAYRNPALPVEERVRDLLRRMTVEEKAQQLIQLTIGKDANPDNLGPDNPFNPLVGSILSFKGGAAARNAFQRAAVEKTRLGIPILWGYDVIHGWRTCFPVSIAQACSFNPALTERLSRVSAEECWADGGVNWTFSPMVEVCHDPRWGRVVEGYGEDPFTAGAFTAAAVRGYQGRRPGDLARPGHVAACLKHFVGYSASEGGRDYSYTDISGRALWEWYLPPFEAGVRAGARTVMSSFNDITGVPSVANHYTQTEILRNRWGFEGFVVSDWGAVDQLRDMGYASDPGTKTLAALLAGNDMDMADNVFRVIPQLVADGRLKKVDLDRAVGRVLRVKFELGLFEHPYTPELPEEKTCLLPASLELARDCARESIVLLKNEGGILPLAPKKVKRIALVGPLGDDYHAHLGSWRAMVEPNAKYATTLLEQARAFFPGAEVAFAPGCSMHNDGDFDAIEAAGEVAEAADLVLFACGEEGWQTGEYKSRHDLTFPGLQDQLLTRLAATGKPIVALVMTGRPLAIGRLLDHCAAVLYLWQSGARAAEAAMEILTGAVNPSGRLSMTFPRVVGQIPVYYNCHSRSRHWAKDYTADAGDDHADERLPDGPQLPFGFGLSYTTFEYGPVKVARRGGGFAASVAVTNTGKRAGKETVLWYLTDVEATYTQPVRRVIGFEKIDLAPGETKTVRLHIDPLRDLSYPDEDGQRILEEGEFRLSAGGRSEASFRLTLPERP